MTYDNGYLHVSAIIGLALLLASCGSDDNAPMVGCDTPMTVEYVNNAFANEEVFVFNGISASDTTLIHEDGNQGNTFDIDTIILSRVTHSSGNSLAVSTSTYATSSPSSDTYMVFYIDVDKNASTGQTIDGIGADALILDNLPGEGSLSPMTERFQVWDNTNWVGVATLGSFSSAASYFAGCTLGLSIHVPLSVGIDSLYATNVRGVMKLIRLTNGDPDTPVAAAAVDSTSVFDFMVP